MQRVITYFSVLGLLVGIKNNILLLEYVLKNYINQFVRKQKFQRRIFSIT